MFGLFVLWFPWTTAVTLVLSWTSSAFRKLLPFPILPDCKKVRQKIALHSSSDGRWTKRKDMKIKPLVFHLPWHIMALVFLRLNVFLFSWGWKVNKHWEILTTLYMSSCCRHLRKTKCWECIKGQAKRIRHKKSKLTTIWLFFVLYT